MWEEVCWGPTPYHTSLHLPHSSPHTPTQFPTLAIHSITPLPTLLHSLHIFPYLPTHFPAPPPTPPYLLPQLPSPPPTPKHTSSLTSCTLPHLPPQFRLCGEVTLRRCYLNKFNWKSPIKFFTTTGNLKSCFSVGNVNLTEPLTKPGVRGP